MRGDKRFAEGVLVRCDQFDVGPIVGRLFKAGPALGAWVIVRATTLDGEPVDGIFDPVVPENVTLVDPEQRDPIVDPRFDDRLEGPRKGTRIVIERFTWLGPEFRLWLNPLDRDGQHVRYVDGSGRVRRCTLLRWQRWALRACVGAASDRPARQGRAQAPGFDTRRDIVVTSARARAM